MDQRLIEPFLESTKNILKEIAEIEIISFNEAKQVNQDFSSLGVSSSISFSGKMKGRFIIDTTEDIAKYIIEKMMGEKITHIKNSLYLSGISEMNNTIAGDANTYLNNTYGLGLRLAPPIVFSGKKIMVATSKIDSITVHCMTKLGEINLNIAFQGGELI